MRALRVQQRRRGGVGRPGLFGLFGLFCLGFGAVAASAAGVTAAQAGDAWSGGDHGGEAGGDYGGSDDGQRYGWREMWAGADATRDVWLLYSGVTLAPLGKDVYSDGIRFRMSGGYGRYNYSREAADCSIKIGGGNTCAFHQRRFDVSYRYGAALVGYHKQLGPLTAKAFAGATVIDHHYLTGIDGESKTTGLEIGATAALEFWLNVGDTAWTSLDFEYTTAHSTGAARWRAGWRVLPSLSVGPEARFDRNASASAGRGGVFARYEWAGGEFSVSTGFAKPLLVKSEDGLSPYVNVNVLTQF